MRKKLLQVITPDQIKHVLHSISHTSAHIYERQRNHLLVYILWDTMIRRQELMRLKIDDLNMTEGIIKIHGKGRKQRYVPMGTSVIRLLHKFLNFYWLKVPGNYLICTRNGVPLKPRYIDKIFERISEGVGFKIRPHLIRHSAATWAIKQGMSPAILQKILGHSSIKTTETYLHISGQDIAESYQKFSPGNALIE